MKTKKQKELEDLHDRKYKRVEESLSMQKKRNKKLEVESAFSQEGIEEVTAVNKDLDRKIAIVYKEKEEVTVSIANLKNQIKEAKGLEEEIKEWKSECKAKLNCSKELKAKLRCSEELHEFIAPALEKNLKKKAEEKKKGSQCNRRQ